MFAEPPRRANRCQPCRPPFQSPPELLLPIFRLDPPPPVSGNAHLNFRFERLMRRAASGDESAVCEGSSRRCGVSPVQCYCGLQAAVRRRGHDSTRRSDASGLTDGVPRPPPSAHRSTTSSSRSGPISLRKRPRRSRRNSTTKNLP